MRVAAVVSFLTHPTRAVHTRLVWEGGETTWVSSVPRGSPLKGFGRVRMDGSALATRLRAYSHRKV